MKRIGLAAAAVLLLSCGIAQADERVTTITPDMALQLRAHSASHGTVGARKMQMLYAPTLEDGCTSVYLYADDDIVMYATLMKAVTIKSTFVLIYDTAPARRGPWGDPLSCPLTSVTIKL
ncbi:hypothetical protein CDN99_20045 [Roseateles aquatilis]|uniref:Uncharacterized protein n=1 Tax=Roseateles aquatilis TaxID=431061 RepID=A0A246J306_9BURK|nr:hypothetical protein [Roseateles aquatilis]OWQ86990.1 hypothetical protein CDN99_20045 [Roseateles aquatilis]